MIEYRVLWRRTNRPLPNAPYEASFDTLAQARSFVEHVKSQDNFQSARIQWREIGKWKLVIASPAPKPKSRELDYPRRRG